jgi:hypothetical protein
LAGGYTVSEQVPHSHCSLRENTKFLPNFRPKNNTLTDNCLLIFFFFFYHFNSGLALKNEDYFITSQILCIPKLTSKMPVSFVTEAQGPLSIE